MHCQSKFEIRTIYKIDSTKKLEENMADEFSFQITEQLKVISTSKSGWTLELNKVSWGGRPAKYDLRSWAPDHQKMGKGITLTDEELEALKTALNEL